MKPPTPPHRKGAAGMADAATALPEAPPKPGLVKRLMLPLVLLLGGAAAGAAGSYFMPVLLPASQQAKPPAPKVAPLEYVEISNSFTANLKDTGRFVQVKIAISTQGGEPVVVDGRVVGAVGVSGVKAGEDARVARAGVDALLACAHTPA